MKVLMRYGLKILTFLLSTTHKKSLSSKNLLEVFLNPKSG